ncbi:RNA polymerase sigma-70 factor [soil metagenome]
MDAAILIANPYRIKGMGQETDTALSLLPQRDEPAFEEIFKSHFKRLHCYALTILKDETEAEEIVQQVFFKLWERTQTQSFSGSLNAYLYRSVHNESLNFLKHRQVRANHQLHVAYSMKQQTADSDKKLAAAELEQHIHAALNELPEQCRTIFQLSRFDELKYIEIADKLGLSVKTVENQMGKALKMMRIKLVHFLKFLILFFHI